MAMKEIVKKNQGQNNCEFLHVQEKNKCENNGVFGNCTKSIVPLETNGTLKTCGGGQTTTIDFYRHFDTFFPLLKYAVK